MKEHNFILEKLEKIRSLSQYRQLSHVRGESFVHNDYLGMSQHPFLIETGMQALEKYGAGSRGSRLLGGNSDLFEEVETKIAHYFSAPASVLFSSGFLANFGIICTLGQFFEKIYSDENNHASLIDAIRLSGKSKEIVPHNRWDLLGPQTKDSLVVCEGLYSMEGDLLIFDRLLEGGAFCVVDEAHSAGVFYEQGRGIVHPIPDWKHCAKVVTFGKAFGVCGAAVLCSVELRDLLINEARTFIYTTAPSPVIVAMIGASLDIVGEAKQLRDELWQRAVAVRQILKNALHCSGLASGKMAQWNLRSPIIPISISGERNCLRFCENMRESGFELRAIRYPTVARGKERVRISLNLGVTKEKTLELAEELVRQWMVFSSQEQILE